MGNTRNIAFWVVLFLLVVALFNMFSNSTSTLGTNEERFSGFMQAVGRGEVKSVVLNGEKIMVTGTNGDQYLTIQPQGAASEVTDALLTAGVSIEAKPQEQSGIMSLVGVWLPFLLL
ncbi:MAG TPA: cell division protein FtsH, partial [Rhodobacteraceae bacterium]|nr:cell division protein FtsH [Paracoccaceae bacterium]